MKEYSSYTSLKVEEVERGILLVTFQRPAHLNAVTREVVVELTEAFFEAGNNEEIDSVILTGEGRAFSAGVEINDLKKGLHEAVPIEIARRMLLTVIECPRITIAALNGDAAGGGASLAFCFDFLVATESARIGEIHPQLGLVPPMGPVILPLTVGLNRARRILMKTELTPSRLAMEEGLIHQVVPDGHAVEAAIALARELQDGPRRALRNTKYVLMKWVRDAFDRIADASLGLEYLSSTTAEHEHGVAAFLGKRRPEFRAFAESAQDGSKHS